jgi:hypothetical protein
MERTQDVSEPSDVSWRERVEQTWCELRGHDTVVVIEPGWIYLRCLSCGYQSPGWRLNEVDPIN